MDGGAICYGDKIFCASKEGSTRRVDTHHGWLLWLGTNLVEVEDVSSPSGSWWLLYWSTVG